MKIILSLTQLLIFSIILNAQWFMQDPLPQSNHLFSVYFTNSNTGWAVGNAGTILKTTNAGENWIIQTSGTANWLWSVYFTDSNTGWAVGQGGTILKTTNGGSSWASQTSGTTNWLSSVIFNNSNLGWAVGENGTIIFTSNGGSNWTSQSSGTSTFLYSVFFINANIGWAVGRDGIIRKTTNGGANWNVQVSGTEDWLFSVVFTNEFNGWIAGGNGTILRTTNGGGTWSPQLSGTTDWLFSIFFIDSNTGWVAGGNGTILNTNNSGLNWDSQSSGTTEFLRSVYFIDQNKGWAVGNNGVMLKAENGGLPVELISFSAKQTDNSVILNWQTATEVNNYGFEIERTSPRPSPLEGEGGEAGRGWHKIGFVQGNGNSNAPKKYTFIDNNPPSGIVQYRLKQIDNDGSFKYSDYIEVNLGAPKRTELFQNYPNPLNPSTAIKFSLSKETNVKITVYDILGNVVNELVNEDKQAGNYIIYWNGNDTKGNKVSSGTYIYKLEAGQVTKIKKMNLVK